MSDNQSLARRALRAALETRRMVSEAKTDPVCVFDLAERLGIEVQFCLGNSFGGAYARASKTVLVPSLRPAGRQSFTCAHEMGHWFFEHGNRIDQLFGLDDDARDDPEERLVNLYAGYLLMPVWAVDAALAARGWVAERISPVQMYTLACQLGVGYDTLVHHLSRSLNKLSFQRAAEFLRITPKDVRREVLGDDRLRHLVIADQAWRKIAIDMQVGDVAVIEPSVGLSGSSAHIIGTCSFGMIVEGLIPGVTMTHSSDRCWNAAIRVRRKNFHGRNIYRHMEDPDVDETP